MKIWTNINILKTFFVLAILFLQRFIFFGNKHCFTVICCVPIRTFYLWFLHKQMPPHTAYYIYFKLNTVPLLACHRNSILSKQALKNLWHIQYKGFDKSWVFHDSIVMVIMGLVTWLWWSVSACSELQELVYLYTL